MLLNGARVFFFDAKGSKAKGYADVRLDNVNISGHIWGWCRRHSL